MKARSNGARRQLLRSGVIVLMVFVFLTFAKTVTEARVEEKAVELTMKTVCIGRFLIDVPKNAVVTFGATTLGGWRITTNYDETAEEFKVRLAHRETELRLSKNAKGWDSMELSSRVKADTGYGQIFVFNRQWTHVIKDDKRVNLEVVSVDGLVRLEDGSFDFQGEYLSTEHVAKLTQLIKQLRSQRLSSFSHTSGFCFERSLVGDPLQANQNESTVMFVGLPEHPDLTIAVRTAAGLAPVPSLLARDSASDIKRRYSSRIHTLRRGERTVNRMHGEELLDRVRESDGVVGHDFEWEAFSAEDDVLKPALAVEMSTGRGRPGKPVRSSLNDAQAIALWDRVVSSLRKR